MAKLIDGKAQAKAARDEIAASIRAHTLAGARPPGLVTILVGDDPASKIYVGRKQKQAAEVGIMSCSEELGGDTTQSELLRVIERYNARDDIDGILVQLPLPAPLDADEAVAALDPAKDVDGLHPVSQGLLLAGRKAPRPCTPLGCMHLLDSTGVDATGKRAVVLGRSNLVGKPVAMMLLERNATVVMCHSRTVDLAERIAEADILVAAVGRPEMVRGEWIREGAVVIDVGINRTADGIVGDVDFEGASRRAAHITPVPGGVGQMTVAMLLANTRDAWATRLGLDVSGSTTSGSAATGASDGAGA